MDRSSYNMNDGWKKARYATRMTRTTKIAGRDVPIEAGEVIAINFTGGPGPR
jgi:hypothetical protein